MKKYFLFAAVAGMMASCSSESLTGSDPNIEPTQEDRVPILLSVSSPSIDVARGTTRGTGTVGGVGTGANQWYGQRIKAFMFKKGSLNPALEDESVPTSYLYKDLEMITPGTVDNIITPVPGATSGEAMISDGTIKYYPASDKFDFFGYHVDDAITGSLNESADPWTVPFTINGSQDLMSTKAAPLAWGELSAAQQAKFGDNETDYNTFITGGDFYSAKAARKLIQPVLKFNHLLTRLSFVIKAGDDSAAGWNGTAQVAGNAVNVNSIQVESKTTGKMAVAWAAADPGELITWDGDGAPAWLALKERPVRYCLNSAPATSTSITKAAYDALPDGAEAGDANDKTDYSLGYCLKSNPTTVITKTVYDALPDGATGGDANDKTDYTVLTNANDALIALNPTYPTVTPTVPADGTYTADETPIGEALIVAPNGTTGYNMKVNVSQLVPQNWTNTPGPAVKSQNYDLVIPAPDGGFKANTSYKVILTVYGFERIQVTTEIIPWQTGADIPVGQD